MCFFEELLVWGKDARMCFFEELLVWGKEEEEFGEGVRGALYKRERSGFS